MFFGFSNFFFGFTTWFFLGELAKKTLEMISWQGTLILATAWASVLVVYWTTTCRLYVEEYQGFLLKHLQFFFGWQLFRMWLRYVVYPYASMSWAPLVEQCYLNFTCLGEMFLLFRAPTHIFRFVDQWSQPQWDNAWPLQSGEFYWSLALLFCHWVFVLCVLRKWHQEGMTLF